MPQKAKMILLELIRVALSIKLISMNTEAFQVQVNPASEKKSEEMLGSYGKS